MKEIKICAFCKNEIEPLDYHCRTILADSPTEKRFLLVTCVLNRYYHVEPMEQK